MHVCVDFFKPSGKWYTEEWFPVSMELDASDRRQQLIEQIEKSHFHKEFTAVCVDDDYTVLEFPLMVRSEDEEELKWRLESLCR